MIRLVALLALLSRGYGQTPEVQRLLDASKIETDQQHFETAAKFALQGIDKSRAAVDKRGLAAGYVRLSAVYFYARNLPGAVDAARQAEAAAVEAGDKQLLAVALGRAADSMRDLGKLEEARVTYQRQLGLYTAAQDRKGVATNFRMTALLYRLMGDSARAHANADKALRLAHELKDPELEGQSLFVLGFLESQQDQSAAALGHLNEALAMPSLNALTRGQIVRMLGTLHCNLRQYGQCTAMIQRQLEMAIASGNQEQVALAYFKLREPQSATGAHRDAYESSLKALTVLRATAHDPFEEWHFLSAVAEELHSLGKLREAVRYFDEAIAIVENLRQGLVPDEASMAKAAADPSTKQLFEHAIENRFGFDPAGAFRIAELARARAFLAILAESKVNLRSGLSETARRHEAGLLRSVLSLQTGGKPLKASELETAERALENFRLDMRRSNPRLAQVEYPQPLTIEQVRRSLKPGQTLIEFTLGEQRSFVWAVSHDRVTSAALPAAKKIEAAVAAFRSIVTTPVSGLTLSHSEAALKQCTDSLYGALLKPIEGSLEQSRELIIVPDGVLYYLPFDALAAPGTTEYLMQRYSVAYAPSATSFVQSPPRLPTTTSLALLAIGDPALDLGALPYTRQEVTGIASLFPAGQSKLYLGAAAREPSLAHEPLDHYRYIHFATHGMLDETHPSRSGLALTPEPGGDGVIRVDWIAARHLNADVVTLSACNTALGQLVAGEGMLGLVRAFLYAGSASVNVSLWPVNDAATPLLMREFYRNLTLSMAPAESLRRAKIAMLDQANRLWRHPHYWAPFVLWLP